MVGERFCASTVRAGPSKSRSPPLSPFFVENRTDATASTVEDRKKYAREMNTYVSVLTSRTVRANDDCRRVRVLKATPPLHDTRPTCKLLFTRPRAGPADDDDAKPPPARAAWRIYAVAVRTLRACERRRGGVGGPCESVAAQCGEVVFECHAEMKKKKKKNTGETRRGRRLFSVPPVHGRRCAGDGMSSSARGPRAAR